MIKRNKKPLTIELIKQEAKSFAEKESKHSEPSLYGVTDGKAVGTLLGTQIPKEIANALSLQSRIFGKRD